MIQLSIGQGPNPEWFLPVDLPLIGEIRRNDVLSIIAMENFDEYQEMGFGTAFRMRVDDVLETSEDGCGQGLTGPEVQGTLVGQYPSWMRRKRIMWAPRREGWLMNLGDGESRWSLIMMTKEAN